MLSSPWRQLQSGAEAYTLTFHRTIGTLMKTEIVEKLRRDSKFPESIMSLPEVTQSNAYRSLLRLARLAFFCADRSNNVLSFGDRYSFVTFLTAQRKITRCFTQGNSDTFPGFVSIFWTVSLTEEPTVVFKDKTKQQIILMEIIHGEFTVCSANCLFWLREATSNDRNQAESCAE